MQKYILTGLLCLASLARLFAQPTIDVDVCSGAGNTSLYSGNYFGIDDIPSSPGDNCHTTVHANFNKDPNKENYYPGYPASISVRREGGETTLAINWSSSFRGVAYITVWYQRQKRTFPFGCQSERPVESVTYRITKEIVDPHGQIEGEGIAYVGKPRHIFSIKYVKDEQFPFDIRKVHYKVPPRGYVSKDYGVPVDIEITSFGTSRITTEIEGVCGNMHEGPYKDLIVRPSCYNDNFAGWTVTGPDGDIPFLNNGYQVEPDIFYTFSASGVDDVISHYNIYTPDENDVILTGNSFKVVSQYGSFDIQAERLEDRGDCPELNELNLFVNGTDVVLERECPIVIPDDLADFDLNMILTTRCLTILP